jgi:AcrR family transcriptional regulator
MKTMRPYVMRERAQQAERTRERVLQATIALGYRNPLAQVTVRAVAESAGVSVQTVLRQFGTRDALIAAAITRAQGEVRDERTVDPDDLGATMDALMAHYERVGDGMLGLLGRESWEPEVAAITTAGRAIHRDWVGRAFARALRDAPDPDAATDLLVAATDLYVWKLFRRDRRLSRAATAARMRALVDAVLTSLGSGLPVGAEPPESIRS